MIGMASALTCICDPLMSTGTRCVEEAMKSKQLTLKKLIGLDSCDP